MCGLAFDDLSQTLYNKAQIRILLRWQGLLIVSTLMLSDRIIYDLNQNQIPLVSHDVRQALRLKHPYRTWQNASIPFVSMWTCITKHGPTPLCSITLTESLIEARPCLPISSKSVKEPLSNTDDLR